MRVAVVFGAGGAAGWLFHAAVSRAIAAETGWHVGQADLLVGTSAGAAVAAGMRAGATEDEFVEAILTGPSDAELAAYRERLAARPRSLTPVSPGLVRHVLPGNGGVAVAVAGLLPPGRHFTDTLARLPGVAGHDGWPAGLWVPAVRVADGRLVVFGRDRTDVAVDLAVEASSAVPGIFAPVDIGGEAYMDGGLASPTNAELAAGIEPDLVLVSSPMTRPSRRPLLLLARRRLRDELEALRKAGVRVAVAEPREDADAFRRFSRRDPGAAPEVSRAAAAAARRALDRPGVRELLAGG